MKYSAYRVPICTVATAVKVMGRYCGTVIVCDSNPVTVSVHIVTNMYGSHNCASIAVQFLGLTRTVCQYLVFITGVSFNYCI